VPMNRIILALALLAFGLAACSFPSTKEVPASAAVAVSGDKIRNLQLTTPRDDAAQVIVVRDSGYIGSKCPLTVSVDKVPAAELMPGERIDLYVRPGVRIVAAEANGGACGRGQTAFETNAVVGEVRKLRIAMNGETFELSVRASAL
jgi:hypothetical protein